MAAVRTLTRASALVLTRHARASPSPSCAALLSHAVRARVHELPRVSVGSPRGKSAAPSATLASGLQGLRCSLGVARASLCFWRAPIPQAPTRGCCSPATGCGTWSATRRRASWCAMRRRRSAPRTRCWARRSASATRGAAARGRKDHVATSSRRGYRIHPAPGLYIHTFRHKWPLSPRPPSVTCPCGRGCARTWVFMCAWVCGVAWQARKRASVTCLARRATALGNPRAPTGDRTAHPGRADV